MAGFCILLLELGYDDRLFYPEFKGSVKDIFDALNECLEIDSPGIIVTVGQFLAYGYVDAGLTHTFLTGPGSQSVKVLAGFWTAALARIGPDCAGRHHGFELFQVKLVVALMLAAILGSELSAFLGQEADYHIIRCVIAYAFELSHAKRKKHRQGIDILVLIDCDTLCGVPPQGK